MTATPITSTKNAPAARSVFRRVLAGPRAPLALVSATPAGVASPAAVVARWDLAPTGLRLRWRLGGAPRADDAPYGDSAA